MKKNKIKLRKWMYPIKDEEKLPFTCDIKKCVCNLSKKDGLLVDCKKKGVCWRYGIDLVELRSSIISDIRILKSTEINKYLMNKFSITEDEI